MGTNDNADLDRFGKALELLQASDWAKAAALFKDVIAQTEGIHLRDRARQMLAICEHQLADDVEVADPYLGAVFEKNRGNLDEAMALIEKAGTDNERFAFLAASVLSLKGDIDEALEHLDNAIRLEPKNRVHAYHDPDFRELREHEEFQSLVAGS